MDESEARSFRLETILLLPLSCAALAQLGGRQTEDRRRPLEGSVKG